jgi:hypothetical protein
MRLGFISDRQCIRVVKEGVALMTLGHKVTSIAQQACFGYNLFDSFSLYRDQTGLQRTIRALDPSIDIWHAHNEPDYFVRLIKEVSDKPVVWDIHDLESLMAGEGVKEDEDDCMHMADAFVHVGDGIREYTEKLHPIIKDKPAITLPLYINEMFYSKEYCLKPSWSSIIYEGGLSVEGFKKLEDGTIGTNYRWWYPVFEMFIKGGYNVTAMASGDDYQKLVYQSLGVTLYPDVSYPVMLNGLQPYGFGLVGAYTSFPVMELAMPNKLYEYISAGVVPVVVNAAECAKFVTANECGIVLKSADHLSEQLRPGPKMRKRVLEMRQTMLMENQIHNLVRLYRQLL